MAIDYYAVLGVSRDATDDQLRRAYHRRARELRRKFNPAVDADLFHQLHEAFDILSDPAARGRVDRGEPARPGAAHHAPRAHPADRDAAYRRAEERAERDADVSSLGLEALVALFNLGLIILWIVSSCGH